MSNSFFNYLQIRSWMPKGFTWELYFFPQLFFNLSMKLLQLTISSFRLESQILCPHLHHIHLLYSSTYSELMAIFIILGYPIVNNRHGMNWWVLVKLVLKWMLRHEGSEASLFFHPFALFWILSFQQFRLWMNASFKEHFLLLKLQYNKLFKIELMLIIYVPKIVLSFTRPFLPISFQVLKKSLLIKEKDKKLNKIKIYNQNLWMIFISGTWPILFEKKNNFYTIDTSIIFYINIWWKTTKKPMFSPASCLSNCAKEKSSKPGNGLPTKGPGW